jgi:hypothetical protein
MARAIEEAGAEGLRRLLDLPGQAVAGGLAGLGAGVAPALQRAVSGRRADRA